MNNSAWVMALPQELSEPSAMDVMNKYGHWDNVPSNDKYILMLEAKQACIVDPTLNWDSENQAKLESYLDKAVSELIKSLPY